MKLFTVSILILLANISWSSSGERGNGGDVLYCPQEMPVTLYDLYESQRRGEKLLNLNKFPNYTLALEFVLSRFEAVDKFRARRYKEWLTKFEEETEFLVGVNLVDIPDTGDGVIPHGCELRQVAVQREPSRINRKRYSIDNDIFSQMNTHNKAALVLHELILREAVSLFHNNSILARFFLAQMLLKDFDTDFEKYLDLVRFSRMGTVNYNGLELFEHSIKRFSNGTIQYAKYKSVEVDHPIYGLMRAQSRSGKVFFFPTGNLKTLDAEHLTFESDFFSFLYDGDENDMSFNGLGKVEFREDETLYSFELGYATDAIRVVTPNCHLDSRRSQGPLFFKHNGDLEPLSHPDIHCESPTKEDLYPSGVYHDHDSYAFYPGKMGNVRIRKFESQIHADHFILIVVQEYGLGELKGFFRCHKVNLRCSNIVRESDQTIRLEDGKIFLNNSAYKLGQRDFQVHFSLGDEFRSGSFISENGIRWVVSLDYRAGAENYLMLESERGESYTCIVADKRCDRYFIGDREQWDNREYELLNFSNGIVEINFSGDFEEENRAALPIEFPVRLSFQGPF